MKELVFKGEDNQSLTSSLLVAEKFEKRHVEVMDAIRDYVGNSTLTDNQCISNMFALTDYDVDVNNGTGAVRKAPMFVMNRDGFTLLAMGFTGGKALKFKIEYINAFNKMESELKSQFKVPSSFKEALMLAVEQQEVIEEQQKQIEVMKPKEEFYDQVTGSDNTCDMNTVAKVLDMGIGRNKLFAFLREQKVLMCNNAPMQSYIERGWFRVVESKYSLPSGDLQVYYKTVIYQSGVDGIRKLLIKNMK